MPRLAYSYIRFSSAKQAAGDSLRRQTEGTERVCKQEGWVLDDSLNLRDLGVSAFRGTNVRDGALAGFLEAVQTGRVAPGSVLVVESLDRLSRNQVRTALRLFMDLLDAGMGIYTFNPEREYKPGDQDPLLLIEPLLMFARAHEESLTKSNRGREAWDRKRREAPDRPMTGKLPGWLKLEGGKIVERAEAADVVRDIYKMRLGGLGIRRITNALVERGVTPFGREGRWAETYVHKILAWRAVFGEAQRYVLDGKKRVPTGEALPNYYPAVISEADFYQVQKLMEDALTRKPGRASNDETNLFTGMVFHATDRCTMTLHRPQGNDEVYVYLRSGAHTQGRKGDGTTFPYWVFERAVLDAVCELTPAEVSEKRHKAGSADEEIGKLSREALVTERKLAEAEKKAVEEEDTTTYLAVIKALTKKKVEQTARLEALKKQSAVNSSEALDEARSLVGMMADKRGEERDLLRRRVKVKLGSLVSEVWVVIRKQGSRRMLQGQIWLKSGKMREFVAHHPRLSKADVEPLPLMNLAGVDLRVQNPDGTAAISV